MRQFFPSVSRTPCCLKSLCHEFVWWLPSGPPAPGAASSVAWLSDLKPNQELQSPWPAEWQGKSFCSRLESRAGATEIEALSRNLHVLIFKTNNSRTEFCVPLVCLGAADSEGDPEMYQSL